MIMSEAYRGIGQTAEYNDCHKDEDGVADWERGKNLCLGPTFLREESMAYRFNFPKLIIPYFRLDFLLSLYKYSIMRI